MWEISPACSGLFPWTEASTTGKICPPSCSRSAAHVCSCLSVNEIQIDKESTSFRVSGTSYYFRRLILLLCSSRCSHAVIGYGHWTWCTFIYFSLVHCILTSWVKNTWIHLCIVSSSELNASECPNLIPSRSCNIPFSSTSSNRNCTRASAVSLSKSQRMTGMTSHWRSLTQTEKGGCLKQVRCWKH